MYAILPRGPVDLLALPSGMATERRAADLVTDLQHVHAPLMLVLLKLILNIKQLQIHVGEMYNLKSASLYGQY